MADGFDAKLEAFRTERLGLEVKVMGMVAENKEAELRKNKVLPFVSEDFDAIASQIRDVAGEMHELISK